FTTNFPNATKIKRGRGVAQTDLLTPEWADLGAAYNVEDFEVAPVVESPPTAPAEAIDIPDTVELSRLDPDFRNLIEQGPGEKKIGDGTRSAYTFKVACALVAL